MKFAILRRELTRANHFSAGYGFAVRLSYLYPMILNSREGVGLSSVGIQECLVAKSKLDRARSKFTGPDAHRCLGCGKCHFDFIGLVIQKTFFHDRA